MIFAALFLLSFSSLAYQVLLTRVFAISQWHHLAFMVIGVALFGFGASGALFSMLDARRAGWEKRWATDTRLGFLILTYTLVAIAAILCLNRLPLDYFRLPLEPIQILYLTLACLLVALPFFLSGSAISLAYAASPSHSGRIYFLSMIGSAIGALFPAMGLVFLDEGRLLVVVAVIPACLPLLWMVGRILVRSSPSIKAHQLLLTIASILVIVCVAAMIGGVAGDHLRISPSPYKELYQVQQYPQTRIYHAHSSIRGQLHQVKSPYIRFAPGLSLTYTGPLPAQQAIYRDGNHRLVLYDTTDPQALTFTRFTLPYAGYHLAYTPQRILVIQDGGGSALACALATGTRDITILESHPATADMVRRHYGLHVAEDIPRAWLAQKQRRFDVVHLETWGASIPGATSLNPNYLLTTDAFETYWQHLTARGVIIVSRRLRLPPADTLRLFATAWQCLKQNGIEQPDKHLVLLRNWDTVTLLMSARPLTTATGDAPLSDDLTIIRNFTRQLNFDPIHWPSLDTKEVNRFNIFEHPFHFNAVEQLMRSYENGTSKAYFHKYLLDIRPCDDGRPFPDRFLKWTRLPTHYETTGRRLYTLLLSGEVVVTVLLIQALIITAVILALPMIRGHIIAKQRRSAGGVYFLGLGCGFMLMEFYYIHEGTRLCGDPAISVILTLAGMLTFSGLGGYFSRNASINGLRFVYIGLLFMLAVMAAGSHQIMSFGLELPPMGRYAFFVLLMAPLGLLMGVPFPMGMRLLLTHPAQRAYAWAANGCASVMASTGAAQIAISQGITTLVIAALVAYGIGWIGLRNFITGRIDRQA